MPATKRWYVADFETTSPRFYKEYGYTKVWLYAICDSNANMIKIGTDIEDFMQCIKKLYGSIIYFHNLKFDGEFILSYLCKNFEYDSKLSKAKTFKVLIGEMGEFYGIDICFVRGRQVHIHDSLKLLPFKVKKIAQDFGLPIEKEIIDYDDYTVNETTISYISKDVQIVAMALSQIKEEGMTRRTTAGCAYNQFKSMKNEDYMQSMFPPLETEFLDEWRQAYRGGRSQVNPMYKDIIMNNIYRYDINSMYPAIMYNERLPYGQPIPLKKEQIGSMKFELYHIMVEFELKEEHLPSLLKKGSMLSEQSYYIDSDGIIELWISNIDMELLKRNYDISYLEYIKAYGFTTTTLIFKSYIDKWYGRKQKDSGAKKVVDKLMLNCLYGKFGSNHKGYTKIPYYDYEDDIVRYRKSEEEDMKHYYLPIAIAITSYAHKYLDDAINEVGLDNFLYCDTDSVHIRCKLPDYMVHQTELGKFKLEAIEEVSKYVRQKCYVTKENGNIHITCAGMTDDMKNDAIMKYGNGIFKYFTKGFSITGKLLPKHVKGGIILDETTFEIR